MTRDLMSFASHLWGVTEDNVLDRIKLRNFMAEALNYVRNERKVSSGFDKRILEAFATFIKMRGARDLFFPASAKMQTEVPLPEQVSTTDFGGGSNTTMPTNDFLDALRKASDKKSF
jgi:hypothetical protein